MKSKMGLRTDQRGVLNTLLIPLILLLLMVLGAGGFGLWAYGSRQDYKNNVDQKIAAAEAKTKQTTQDEDRVQYAEAAKQPLDTYIGPSAFGNITVKYPKTWSAYVKESSGGGSPVNAYFQPNFVPNVDNQKNAYALHIELVQQSYDQVMAQFGGLVQSKAVTVVPYSLPKVPTVVGSRVEGQLTPDKQGVMIVLPLRNQALKISTEATQFKADLDAFILPNLTFQP
jgi:hypothetical protein